MIRSSRYPLLIAERVKKRRRRRGHTRLSSKNQATIPVDVLRAAGVEPGDELRVEAAERGRIVLTQATDPLDRYIGALSGVYPPGYLRELREQSDAKLRERLGEPPPDDSRS